jgi:hypothetical protein
MYKHVVINDVTFDIDATPETTLAQVQQAAARKDASLANAVAYVSDDGETVMFRFVAGTKGAPNLTKAVYGQREFNLEGAGSDDPEAIRRGLAALDASVANASYRIEGSTIEFFIAAGTKG